MIKNEITQQIKQVRNPITIKKKIEKTKKNKPSLFSYDCSYSITFDGSKSNEP